MDERVIVGRARAHSSCSHGAGFMMRGFLTLYRLDVGVDTSHLLTMRLYCRSRSTRNLVREPRCINSLRSG